MLNLTQIPDAAQLTDDTDLPIVEPGPHTCAIVNDGLGTVILPTEAIAHSSALGWKALAWPIWAALGAGAIGFFWCAPAIASRIEGLQGARGRKAGTIVFAVLAMASLFILAVVPGATLKRLPSIDGVWCAIVALWAGAGFLLSTRLLDKHPYRRWFAAVGTFAVGAGTFCGIVVDVWKRAATGIDVAPPLGVVVGIAVAVIAAALLRWRRRARPARAVRRRVGAG
jgi:hypothetical protein